MAQQKTKNSTNGERNWSELPQDIIHLFSKKLPDISDFIHLRAVCKSWQLSVPVTNPPLQLPWLLERRQEGENPIIRFFCLSSGKVHTIACPSSCHVRLYGPGGRYLLAYHVGNNERYLLNPLTSDQIHVPDGFLPENIGLDKINGGNVVVVSRNTNMMGFWQPEADDWVYVEGVGNWYSGNAYYMGQYFSHDKYTGITNVIDIATKKMAYQVAPPEGTNTLLKGRTIIIESGGKILRLFHHSKTEPCHFDIYCLHFSDGERNPCWMKITNIGDQMLFLQYYRGLSVCASNFPGFEGNCIYFLKKGRYLCRYDIGNGTTEVLRCPFDLVGTWFVPSLV
ncbi:putative F-box/kelch-repeat protein At5g24040 [Carex rostrata]